jgi:hypothetical protein
LRRQEHAEHTHKGVTQGDAANEGRRKRCPERGERREEGEGTSTLDPEAKNCGAGAGESALRRSPARKGATKTQGAQSRRMAPTKKDVMGVER